MRIGNLGHGLFGRLAPGDIQAFESWRDVARHVYRNSAQGITMYRSVVSDSLQQRLQENGMPLSTLKRFV